MSTYIVTRKSDGVEVYRYNANAPIEWGGMEFVTHDHAQEVIDQPADTPVRGSRRRSKLGFIALIGDDFAGILSAAKVSVEVEMFVRMLDWATPDADGTSVDLDDPRVVSALTRLEAAQLLPVGKAQEILNG